VQGEVHATGDVVVDDEANVNASIAGGDVSIRGHVSGPVTARKRLVVARSGSLNGDVKVARLVIQDGATFSGKVSMGPQSDPVAEPAKVEPEAQAEPAPVTDGKEKPPSGKGKLKR
jgi:cytoskeletal protein CcmA (bactofilin family)